MKRTRDRKFVEQRSTWEVDDEIPRMLNNLDHSDTVRLEHRWLDEHGLQHNGTQVSNRPSLCNGLLGSEGMCFSINTCQTVLLQSPA